MKTVLQRLIDFGWKNLDSNPLFIVRAAEKLLKQEKQQIIDAFKNSDINNTSDEQAEDYYNTTFETTKVK